MERILMSSEKGQSIVEFALILPLVILMIFGILDFGRVFHAYLAIDHAGREAARAASIGKDNTTILNTAVNDATSIGLKSEQVVIDPSGSRSSGTEAKITISYPVTFLTPIIGNLISPLTLTNTTVMRVE
jgi:uncharacterized protein (UPF0333 family)